jgi:hypothetical protein
MPPALINQGSALCLVPRALRRSALCPVAYAFLDKGSALCPMPCALYHIPYTLCFVPCALCLAQQHGGGYVVHDVVRDAAPLPHSPNREGLCMRMWIRIGKSIKK